jgi:hypothetical protein
VRHFGALLLGALVALAAVGVHRTVAAGLPVGLVLAGGASLYTAWHLRRSAVPRAAASYCLGWVLLLGLVLVGRPEGDFALASDADGYALMGVGLLLAAFGVTALLARPPGAAT